MFSKRRKMPMHECTHAHVVIFGSAEKANVRTYEDFVSVLHSALYEWSMPIGRIIITDRLDERTRTYVELYCRENPMTRRQLFRGDWEAYGAAAESLRDAQLLRLTTHGLCFAPNASPSDERLFKRLYREGVMTRKL